MKFITLDQKQLRLQGAMQDPAFCQCHTTLCLPDKLVSLGGLSPDKLLVSLGGGCALEMLIMLMFRLVIIVSYSTVGSGSTLALLI